MKKEIDKYKKLYYEIESQLTDSQAIYDKDKALWEGKFTFLESQRKQAKEDYADAQKKFELTLKHLQRHKNNDKQEIEISHNALI